MTDRELLSCKDSYTLLLGYILHSYRHRPGCPPPQCGWPDDTQDVRLVRRLFGILIQSCLRCYLSLKITINVTVPSNNAYDVACSRMANGL